MDNEIQKNFLIMGIFRSYCLLCDEALSSKISISLHIQSNTHKNNLKSNAYLKNYKEDGIRKVQRGYHCEFCNVLCITKPKVARHVNEDTHKRNRAILLMREVNNGVLAFNKVFVNNKAWHGLIDDACVICEVDIEDVNEHINESAHIFNLVQMKLEFYDDNIFRKVDQDFFNCLTCNLILHVEILAAHFKSENHEIRYAVCRDLYTSHINGEIANSEITSSITNVDVCNNDTSLKELTEKETKESQEKKETPEKIYILPIALEKLDDDSVRDEDKADNKTENIDVPCKGAIARVEGDNFDTETDQAEVYHPQDAFMLAINFAKENGIKYKVGKHSAYCRFCDVKISSSLKRMKEHVASPDHQKNPPKNTTYKRASPAHQNNLPKIRPRLQVNFIEVTTLIGKFVIVDRHILLWLFSFNMMTSNNDVVRCQLCETNMSEESAYFHKQTDLHMSKMSDVLIVNYDMLSDDFIREIRPDLYHCAHCNILSKGFEELDRHHMSLSHNRNKTCHNIILKEIMFNL